MTRVLTRFLLGLCMMGACLGIPHAQAETAAVAPAAPLSPEQAQQVLQVLQDPARRAAFVATLQNMARALPPAAGGTTATAPAAATPAPAAKPAAAAAAAAAPAAASASHVGLAPDSLGAQLLTRAGETAIDLSGQLVETAQAVTDFPLLWGWIRFQVTDPYARAQGFSTLWRLVVVIGASLLVELAARRALRRPLLALDHAAPDGHPAGEPEAEDAVDAGAAAASPEPLPVAAAPDAVVADHEEPEAVRHRRLRSTWILLRRLPFVLLALVLYGLPVLAFAGVGNVLAGAGVGGAGTTRLVILAWVDAYVLTRAVLCVVRALVAPELPRLRLLHVDDVLAGYVTRWARLITVVTVFGLALAQVAVLLGLYAGARDALLKVVMLVVHGFLVVIVLQCRGRVAARLRAPKTARGPFAALRNRIAASWHVVAIFYIVALWVVFALEIQDGFSRLVRFFVLTCLVIGAFRLLAILALGALERGFRISPETAARYPGLQDRAHRYYKLLRSVISVGMASVAAVVLLEVWGLPAVEWFSAGALGGRVVGASVSITVTILLSGLIWEGANTGIQSHLDRLTREAQIARSARLRTLLPILRTMLLVAIAIVGGLSILSDIGVNIAPLLAGAGIVGVAIGFGSQKLVQDFITGLFLLMENAMQVGDWVTLAGLSGSVENLSIRTVRLRAGDGSVHIIPFSSVTTVNNTNRGLGNAAVSVTVAYKEDTDRVSELLKAIALEMRQEDEFKPGMLSDLQLWGVDHVDGGSVTISGQIVCTASGRWGVQREYNRRVKQRFTEAGVEVFNPTITTLVRIEPPAAPQTQAAPQTSPAPPSRPALALASPEQHP